MGWWRDVKQGLGKTILIFRASDDDGDPEDQEEDEEAMMILTRKLDFISPIIMQSITKVIEWDM
jgi:hypothetical protein